MLNSWQCGEPVEKLIDEWSDVAVGVLWVCQREGDSENVFGSVTCIDIVQPNEAIDQEAGAGQQDR